VGDDSQKVTGGEERYDHMVNETGDEHVLANMYVGREVV
jgi:hypothetical protein